MNRIGGTRHGWLVPLLALGTLLVFGGTGYWLITVVQERSLGVVLLGGIPIWWHVVLGLALGALISAGAWFLISRPFMHAVRYKYASLIGPLMSSVVLQIAVSVCAGVGEELFFRGALQYWMGIPLTALVFVSLHGYLDPRDPRVSVYGIYLVGVMVGLGWVADRVGLLAPTVAHTFIDVFLLHRLVKDWRAHRP